jgi:hypothetical protein
MVAESQELLVREAQLDRKALRALLDLQRELPQARKDLQVQLEQLAIRVRLALEVIPALPVTRVPLVHLVQQDLPV